MELLYGRFPHLIEDIFGLLDGNTLYHCGHVNATWNGNLEEHRLYLVKKIQKHLKKQKVVYNPAADFDKKEAIFMSPYTLIIGLPSGLARNIAVEQLPLLYLVQFQKYFYIYKIKDCEFKIRILVIKNIHIQLGVFINNKSNALTILTVGPPPFKIPQGPLISIKFMI